MKTINVDEAKTSLSQLLDLAASGEEVIIARAGKPFFFKRQGYIPISWWFSYCSVIKV
jgi:hypothetical protein